VLTRLQESVRKERPELWPDNWILHHDNVPTHDALRARESLAKKSITKLGHLPYSRQWRLIDKITGGAAAENCIFFINWGMATDIKLKDYILYKYKERIKEKRTHYIIDNTK
jgi:hypothetical protein